MALGTLFVWFVVMCLLGVFGIILMFTVKNQTFNTILLFILTIYSLFIAYMSASALPTNFVGYKFFVWIVGLVAVVGLGIRFFFQKQVLISKFLIACSVVAGIYFLFFS